MKRLVVTPIRNGFLVTPEKKEGECGEDVTSYCEDLADVLRRVYLLLAEYDTEAGKDTFEGFVSRLGPEPEAEPEPDPTVHCAGCGQILDYRDGVRHLGGERVCKECDGDH